MKFKFDPSLEYQLDAIKAVVDLFNGQPIVQSSFELSHTTGALGLKQSELGVGNSLLLTDQQLLENIHRIQERNDIEKVAPGAASFDDVESMDAVPSVDQIGSPLAYGRHFSVEMETGTGKTYVYLRSIFELNKNYGFKKFIIVVPTVPIREGVLKSLKMTAEHFKALYNNVPFDHFVYDSSKLDKVRQFATSNQIQIMVINIQAFQKDVADKPFEEMTEEELKKLNIINREIDKMSGRRPIEFIQAANPIVIIDEPQSVDNTDKAKRAIANLNPLFTLRYSATHRNPYNLLYKLDPIKAYDMRLVKRIEIASTSTEGSADGAYIRFVSADHKNGIKAKLEILKKTNKGFEKKIVTVKQEDDLLIKSDENPAYQDGFIVQHIDATPGAESIEFNQGKFLEIGESIGGYSQDTMKAQIEEAVEQHFRKERLLKGRGIKVLSLFFIDRVANYRVYNDDVTTGLGKIGVWFEEAFKACSQKSAYQGLIPFEISKVHNGYFSQDKKIYSPFDAAQKRTSDKAAEEDTYALIMRDKERLLDPEEPLRFIFSHTALREGWDNPNVFQICTLREVGSESERRQQIGRGLRLPVNDQGERVFDEQVKRPKVIASESYESFAKSLQADYENDFGIKFGRVEKITFAKLLRPSNDGQEKPVGQDVSAKIWSSLRDNGYINGEGLILDTFDPKKKGFELKIAPEFSDLKLSIIDRMQELIFKNRVTNAKDKRPVRFQKEVHLREDFKELWERIKHKTRYRVQFQTPDLIEKAAQRIKKLDKIKAAVILTERANLNITEAGIEVDTPHDRRQREVEAVKVLPDILAYLQKETELTRHTLVEILKKSERLPEFKENPQLFMTMVGREISYALHDLMLEGIQYQKISNNFWEMSLFEPEKELTSYLNNLYEVQNKSKTLFDAIEYQSEPERKFAEELDHNENVKLFVKLPRGFKIETPLGPYNPDWAFVTERDQKLYFVRETKSTLDSEERRTKENQKIKCGKKHFETLGVDFGVVTSLKEVNF